MTHTTRVLYWNKSTAGAGAVFVVFPQSLLSFPLPIVLADSLCPSCLALIRCETRAWARTCCFLVTLSAQAPLRPVLLRHPNLHVPSRCRLPPPSPPSFDVPRQRHFCTPPHRHRQHHPALQTRHSGYPTLHTKQSFSVCARVRERQEK